jgi:hypothetical protein
MIKNKHHSAMNEGSIRRDGGWMGFYMTYPSDSKSLLDHSDSNCSIKSMFNPFHPHFAHLHNIDPDDEYGTLTEDWKVPSELNKNFSAERNDGSSRRDFNPNMVHLELPSLPSDPHDWSSPNLNTFERGPWYSMRYRVIPFYKKRDRCYVVQHRSSKFYRSFSVAKYGTLELASNAAEICAANFSEWNELYFNRVRELIGSPWSEMQASNRPDVLVTIDTGSYPRLKNYTWTIISRTLRSDKDFRNHIEAGIDGKTTKIHRYLTDAKDGLVVDHINGNTLDNRMCNLRLVTQQENCNNIGQRSSTKSGMTGVWEQVSEMRWNVHSLIGKEIVKKSFRYRDDVHREEQLENAIQYLKAERLRRGITPVPRPLQIHINVLEKPIFVKEYPPRSSNEESSPEEGVQ